MKGLRSIALPPIHTAETDNEIENKHAEPNGNLCCHLQYEHCHTINPTLPHFISVSVSVSAVGQCKHATEHCAVTHLSLILMLVSVMGSYWNRMSWRWRTGGWVRKMTPFSASCSPCSPASYLLSPSRDSTVMYSLKDS